MWLVAMVAAQCLPLFLRDAEPCRKLAFEGDKEPLRVLEVSHLVPASPTAEPGPAVKIVFHFSFSWFSLYHLVPVGPLVTGSCFIMTPKNDCLFYLVGMSCALWTFAQHLVHLTQYPCSVACCVYSQVHLVYSPLPCPEHCRKS